MKKQLIALLLAMSMVLSLAACGSKEETQPETEEPQVEEPAAPETEEETEEPTEESEETEAPTEETEAEEDTPEVKPTEKPAEKPAAKPEQKPAEKPAAKPEQKPAEKPQASSVDLTALYSELEQLMISTLGEENAPSMMVMDDDMMAAQYAGLMELKPKQIVIAGPMMGAVVAEFALAEAADAEGAAKIAAVFNNRIAYMVGDEENPGAAWYPASVEGWKQNAKVVTNGNYVMLVAIEGNETYINAFNAKIG